MAGTVAERALSAPLPWGEYSGPGGKSGKYRKYRGRTPKKRKIQVQVGLGWAGGQRGPGGGLGVGLAVVVRDPPGPVFGTEGAVGQLWVRAVEWRHLRVIWRGRW